MKFVIITIFIAVLFRLCQWHLKRYRFIRCLINIPGPPPLPLVGNALELKTPKAVLKKFIEYQNNYGGIVKIYSGQIPNILLVTDYELTRFVLSSPTILGKAPKYKHLEKWLGTGLLLSEGEKWKSRRKIITPTFHFDILEQFLEVFDTNNKILIKKLKKESELPSINIYQLLKLYTLDVICETAMGTCVGAQKDSNLDYIQSIKALCQILLERTFNPFLQYPFLYIFSKQYKAENKNVKVVHDYTNLVIKKRKHDLLTRREKVSKRGKMVFLDLLLEQQKQGHFLTDKDIKEEVNVFLFEGHDTLTSALSFTLYSLAEYPHVQDKAVDELKTIFGSDQSRNPSMRDLQSMRYLDAVIKESLRLFPSVPAYGRCLPEDINYNGTIFPKGLTLVFFAYGIHRDPKLFPKPDQFLPERFLEETNASNLPYKYIPFSAGPRNCIGQKFAMLQMKSLLAAILRNYKVLPAIPKHELSLVIEAVLKSENDVHVRLAPREF